MLNIPFNLETDGFGYVLDHIEKNPNDTINFETHYNGRGYSYGDGATRQVYKKVCDEIESTIFTRHGFYIDINLKHAFWENPSSPCLLTLLFSKMLYSKFKLPWHLPPKILQLIALNPMRNSEVIAHVQRIKPEEYESASKINVSDFEAFDIPYDDHQDFYRSIIMNVSEDKLRIYQEIANSMIAFHIPENNRITCCQADLYISGSYVISAEQVANSYRVENHSHLDTDYITDLWKQYLQSLSQQELRQFLMTVSNTYDIGNNSLIIKNDMQTDIKISTCFRVIRIRDKIFESFETLCQLTPYFTNDNIIYEGETITESYQQETVHDVSSDVNIYPYLAWINIEANQLGTNGVRSIYPPAAVDFDGDELNMFQSLSYYRNTIDRMSAVIDNTLPSASTYWRIIHNIAADIDRIPQFYETPPNPVVGQTVSLSRLPLHALNRTVSLSHLPLHMLDDDTILMCYRQLQWQSMHNFNSLYPSANSIEKCSGTLQSILHYQSLYQISSIIINIMPRDVGAYIKKIRRWMGISTIQKNSKSSAPNSITYKSLTINNNKQYYQKLLPC